MKGQMWIPGWKRCPYSLGPGVLDREPNLQGEIRPDNMHLISSFNHGQKCLNKPIELFIQQRGFYKIFHNFDPSTSEIGPIPPVSACSLTYRFTS